MNRTCLQRFNCEFENSQFSFLAEFLVFLFEALWIPLMSKLDLEECSSALKKLAADKLKNDMP